MKVRIGVSREPFNMSLLKLTSTETSKMKPITSLDTFENVGSKNFHDGGLFSSDIFGRVGEDVRDVTFSYIDIKAQILHSLVYRTVERTTRFYIDLYNGKEYGIWNDKEKQFEKSDEILGDTGAGFFLSKWPELKFHKTDSLIRNQRIEFIDKYRDKAIQDKILVLPAGVRDAEIDHLGRTKEHEINPIYRQMLSVANTIGSPPKIDDSMYDRARTSLQFKFNELYDTIEGILKGKKGFAQSKVGARGIVNGTRNVITAMDQSISSVDDKHAPTSDDTILGLWQVSRGVFPITVSKLRSHIAGKVFMASDGLVPLIDKKTLKSEYVEVKPQTYDRWTTQEGLERVITNQSNKDYRSLPVDVEGRYLALVYKPKDKMVFKILYDIDELPEGAKKSDVHPITYMELIYLCNYAHWNDYKVINTRYPVAGEGSTYPSNVYLMTTIISESRVELEDDWSYPENVEGREAIVYPVYEPLAYIDSAMISPYRTKKAQADYDGDTFSNNILFTKESLLEINNYLNSREAHVDPSGGLRGGMQIDTTEYVIYNLTGD